MAGVAKPSVPLMTSRCLLLVMMTSHCFPQKLRSHPMGLAMDVASSAAAASVSAKKRKVRKVRGNGLRKIRKSKKAA